MSYPFDVENAKKSTRPQPIGNPGALGLFSFASTTLILSLYNTQARGITHPNVVMGMAVFCGGLAQLLAGMFEFITGNVFGGTAFTSYGAFWLSYATILLPGSGILSAYKDPTELSSALGIFLTTWFIVTALFFIVTLRKSLGLVVLFGCLAVTFLLLAIGEFSMMKGITKIAGGLGVITAMVAYYVGLSDLLAADQVHLPVGKF